MPNIRILALAVLQIFCSQGCSYVGEKWHNSRKTRLSAEKKIWVHLFFMYMPHIKFQEFCSQGCSYTKCLCPKKESNSTKNLQNSSKVNQFIFTLVCNYMQNIRILAKAVLQIFCSQGCSYTKCLCPKKANNSAENLWNRFKSESVYLHLDL